MVNQKYSSWEPQHPSWTVLLLTLTTVDGTYVCPGGYTHSPTYNQAIKAHVQSCYDADDILRRKDAYLPLSAPAGWLAPTVTQQRRTHS
ncbi:hypothetical protein MVEG_04467 [Podila verticillata NRRL 6337]|nr:hypothetical protein MVEG_04467 [Podila verticillata NRRL 6337]